MARRKRRCRTVEAMMSIITHRAEAPPLIERLSRRPKHLGATGGRLAPCHASPNCVSSQADGNDRVHFVEPLRFTGASDAAWSRIGELVRSQPRVRIVHETDRYLHAEFTSRILRFVDDFELLLDDGAGVIDVRSASRLGYSDFGVNRQRVEAIRRKFSA
jgi:uncharacterized protein (DUF1499 family)